jgi:hypothetical protein
MSGHISSIDRRFRETRTKAGLPKDIVLYCARHDYGTRVLMRTGNLAAQWGVLMACRLFSFLGTENARLFGSFLPSLFGWFSTTKLTRSREPTLSWNHLHSQPGGKTDAPVRSPPLGGAARLRGSRESASGGLLLWQAERNHLSISFQRYPLRCFFSEAARYEEFNDLRPIALIEGMCR